MTCLLSIGNLSAAASLAVMISSATTALLASLASASLASLASASSASSGFWPHQPRWPHWLHRTHRLWQPQHYQPRGLVSLVCLSTHWPHRLCNCSKNNITAAQASSSTQSCHVVIKCYQNYWRGILLLCLLIASRVLTRDVAVDCLFWRILQRWCVTMCKTIIFC